MGLLFDDTKAKLREQEEWEVIIPLDGDRVDVAQAIAVDFDDRDFVPDAPAGARYVLPRLKLASSGVTALKTDLKKLEKRAGYIAMSSECYYVLAEGIARPEEIPPECGVIGSADHFQNQV